MITQEPVLSRHTARRCWISVNEFMRFGIRNALCWMKMRLNGWLKIFRVKVKKRRMPDAFAAFHFQLFSSDTKCCNLNSTNATTVYLYIHSIMTRCLWIRNYKSISIHCMVASRSCPTMVNLLVINNFHHNIFTNQIAKIVVKDCLTITETIIRSYS